MSATPRSTGPLVGVTVLDLTQFLAGPYATQILGDLGARVVKIEPPGAGELTRKLAPHFFKDQSAYYLSVNRNKESLALDLKNPRGREVFFNLVRNADVVLENFRVGVVDRLGISYNRLKEINPRIVMCSISGFGQTGPYKDRPAYDMIVQAMSGGMSMTGEEAGAPVRAGIPVGYLSAGMFSVIGALAGVTQARATGRGSYVDMSMLDCQVSMLTYQAAYYLLSDEVPGLQGRGHRSFPTYRAFRCKDGIEIVVTANTEKMWRGLCEALGQASLADDPRFSINARRLENREALDTILEAAFAGLSAMDALDRLVSLEVPAGPINTLDRALTDRQVVARDMVVEIKDSAGDAIRVAGNPVKVQGAGTIRHSFPPELGEHSTEILKELAGMGIEEITALARDGVISIASSESVSEATQ